MILSLRPIRQVLGSSNDSRGTLATMAITSKPAGEQNLPVVKRITCGAGSSKGGLNLRPITVLKGVNDG